jgi:hypothetical protein
LGELWVSWRLRKVCGVSQFLDIGTGLPAASNTHEVAQAADPAARVVYVDNDPEPAEPDGPAEVTAWCGVARKPLTTHCRPHRIIPVYRGTRRP